MLSYRHGYHAGNFADVFKHFILVYLLEALKEKKPFAFIDPFAGAGKYYLKDNFMSKNKEYQNGIMKILSVKVSDPFINRYLNYVRHLNIEEVSVYPGSGLLASLILDSKDKIFLSELHNNEFKILSENFKNDLRLKIQKEDAYKYTTKIASSFKGNRLILVDPSYELKTEYKKTISLITHINHQFPNDVIMVWYPKLNKLENQEFIKEFINTRFPNKTHIDIDLKNSHLRMQGNGFFIINSPLNMKKDIFHSLEILLDILKEKKSKDNLRYETFN